MSLIMKIDPLPDAAAGPSYRTPAGRLPDAAAGRLPDAAAGRLPDAAAGRLPDALDPGFHCVRSRRIQLVVATVS
jgi:hypothetical protein